MVAVRHTNFKRYSGLIFKIQLKNICKYIKNSLLVFGHTNRVTMHNVGVCAHSLDLLPTAATLAAAARLKMSRWGTCRPSLATA
jgi:hypothetical protein